MKNRTAKNAIALATILLGPVFPLTVSSCKSQEARMARGFRLPEGNTERGKAAFLQMNCHRCHTVAGIVLPNPDSPSPIMLELGGVVRKAKTYGELVTSVIRSQHIVSTEHLAKLGEGMEPDTSAPMPSFNDTMTVAQMIDVVTFLHEHYQKAPPPGVNYPYYTP